MPKQTGSRPTPSISKGKSPNYSDTRDKTGGTDKSRETHTKSPEGSRPTPGIGRDVPDTPVVPGAVKKPIKHTSMGRPNAAATSGASKKEGGGGY